MAFEVKKIRDELVEKILSESESHFLDFKAIEVSPSKLTKSLSAFANAEGGELYVGIDDKDSGKEWRGFSNQEAANGHVQAFQELFPLDGSSEYVFLSSEQKQGLILKIDIFKTKDIKRASDGVVYIRRSAQNIPVTTPESMKRLEYDKGVSSFESETVEYPIEEFDTSTAMIEYLLYAVPTLDPIPFLRKQQLVKGSKPTVGAVLLFSDSPQVSIPKASVKIARYKTSDQASRETLSGVPITIEGHLYKQIADCVATTRKIIEEIGVLGDQNVEKVAYPHETLHEIITNAILHRDYSIQDNIHIQVFDNRVEVSSPGSLSGAVTVDNILYERSVRNGTLFRLINRYPTPPNMDVGEGLNTAFKAMLSAGLKEPKVLASRTNVTVVIKHEKLASPYVAVLEFLEKNPRITNKVARTVCHVEADYRIKNVFEKLKKRGLIQQISGTSRSTTAYERGPHFSEWRAQNDILTSRST